MKGDRMKEPVKIGGVTAWSGPMATSGELADKVIAAVEHQVSVMGGILGGREVKVIRGDMCSETAEVKPCCKRLLDEDKVAALVWGGADGVHTAASSEFAEERKVLFVNMTTFPVDLSDWKFTVRCIPPERYYERGHINIVTKVIQPKPKTVAIQFYDKDENRERVNTLVKAYQAAGIETIYVDYNPIEALDFMPQLKKIKELNPDVVLFLQDIMPYVSLINQLTELGGFGDTKVVCCGRGLGWPNQEVCQGWYGMALWIPEWSSYPASKKFEEDFQAVNGEGPMQYHLYYYTALWIAIKAIELAGTDTDLIGIAQAARSGNLEVDTPLGLAHFGADGEPGGLVSGFAQIRDYKLHMIKMPE